MSALDHKLRRGLWKLKGQVVAVALIVASGVGTMIMSLSAYDALTETKDAYYERYRFGDVFANLTRAPDSLKHRIKEIPGVRTVDTRINGFANIDIKGFKEPITGQIISIPERGVPLLNQLALQDGRFVEPGKIDEVVLNEPFAEAHGLEPGDYLQAIINGNKRQLKVVGLALSPEFVYAIGPGAIMPDDKRYGIMWMGREALAASFDLDGAFNTVSLALLPNTDPKEVINELDILTEPYGGVGAIARKDQLSNWFLSNEISQQRTFATVLPTIFLLVAAYLTNMVLARLIDIERGEIGLLKSFGYKNYQVAWHYAKLVIAMSLVGIVLGWLVGSVLGKYNTNTYTEFYHFPLLIFKPSPVLFIFAGLISLAAALSGSLSAVKRAVVLPPAQAMRPPSPPKYSNGWITNTRAMKALDQSTRIIIRQLIRQPRRAIMTSLGIAFSIAVMVMILQWLDSLDRMVVTQFHNAQHQDAVLGLVEPRGADVLHDVKHLPGVMAAEPLRWVGADFRHGTRVHRGAIQGVIPDAQLQLVQDVSGRTIKVPPNGLVIGTELGKKLNVGIGDTIWVDVIQGSRPKVEMPVIDMVETYFDLPVYMDLSALNRLLQQGPRNQFISLLVDEKYDNEFYKQLKQTPIVSAVMVKQIAVRNFEDTIAENITITIGFFTVFAAALGFGVVYNSARIMLSERGRELASLRVLGFSRAAISYILLGEVGLLILLALPLGCLVGWCLAWFMVNIAFHNELYRIPLVILPSSYGKAILVTLIATATSALIVRRRLDRLDLIAVLKTRE